MNEIRHEFKLRDHIYYIAITLFAVEQKNSMNMTEISLLIRRAWRENPFGILYVN